MKRLLILFFLVLVIPYPTSSTLIDNKQEYIVTVEDFSNGSYMIGKADGTLEIYNSTGLEKPYGSYLGRNQIVDAIFDEETVLMVSQYNYTEIRSRITGDLIKRTTYNWTVLNVEWKQDGIAFVSELRTLHEINVTSGERVGLYDLLTLPYADSVANPPDCVNCPIQDMRANGTELIVLHGGGLYWINTPTMTITKSIRVEFLTTEMEIDEGNILLIKRESKFVDLYSDNYKRRISTNIRVMDADLNGSQIIVGGERKVEIKELDGKRWKSYDGIYEVRRIQFIGGMIFVGYQSSTSGYEFIELSDFNDIPIISPITIRIIIISLVILSSILLIYVSVRPINRLIIELQIYVNARTGGFNKKEDYLIAMKDGFQDAKIMQMIIAQGYKNYDSYLRALESSNKAGYNTIREMKEGHDRSINLRIPQSSNRSINDAQVNSEPDIQNRSRLQEIKAMIRNLKQLISNYFSLFSEKILAVLVILLAVIVVYISLTFKIPSLVFVLFFVGAFQTYLDYVTKKFTKRRVTLLFVISGIIIILTSSFMVTPGSRLGSVEGEPIKMLYIDDTIGILTDTEYLEIKDGKINNRIKGKGFIDVQEIDGDRLLVTSNGTLLNLNGKLILDLNETNLIDYYQDGIFKYFLKDYSIIVLIEGGNRTEIKSLPISPLENCICNMISIEKVGNNLYLYTKQGYRYQLEWGKIVDFLDLSNSFLKNVKVVGNKQLLIQNGGSITVLDENDTRIVKIKDGDNIIDASWIEDSGELIYSTKTGIKKWSSDDISSYQIVIPGDIPRLIGGDSKSIYFISYDNDIRMMKDVIEIYGRFYHVNYWRLFGLLGIEFFIISIFIYYKKSYR